MLLRRLPLCAHFFLRHTEPNLASFVNLVQKLSIDRDFKAMPKKGGQKASNIPLFQARGMQCRRTLPRPPEPVKSA